MMKLYNLDHSPYATRVRMQIHTKNLDVGIEPSPVALGAPEFVARFPFGKIPILALDNGSHLADSWVIMEYLEDITDSVPLRPAGALARAEMQTLARCADTCLGPAAVFPLFSLVGAGAEAAGVEGALSALDQELTRLERLLQALPDFATRELHLGDIALVPHVDYLLLLAPIFGRENPLAAYPRISAWRDHVGKNVGVARGATEMLTAAKAFFGG
ncbi:MAG: glutathione S-transferase family protein [Halioglobus sp.]